MHSINLASYIFQKQRTFFGEKAIDQLRNRFIAALIHVCMRFGSGGGLTVIMLFSYVGEGWEGHMFGC